MKRYEDALKDFNRAIELENKDSWTIAQRGFTHLLLGHYEDAVRDFEKPILSDPENDWLRYLKSLAYLRLNTLEEALNSLQQAISLAAQEYEAKPDDYLNAFNLALYYLVNKNIKEATQLYQETLNSCTDVYYVEMAATDLEDLLEIIPEHQYAHDVLQTIKSKLTELRSQSETS